MLLPKSLLASSITAQIGPTNTGKTHRAVERMLTHETGMIGLPLRLLAREIYDRVSAQVGEGAVALVTGEEKRMPARPRYFVCTVEAMPADREVDFLAVDEIHLAGHVERGHVFTDRLLGWRGRRETWFLGADTIRPILERLVPTAGIERKPRMSRLSWGGNVHLRGLPPRTAVVAFSVDRVYELAERLRARRGGTAVVMGALSPRARNAQVALYQSGEVDYMVATDAIGMGLNMDVDCVAFADLRKYDGRKLRELEDAELAQIAGRAGRYHNNGKFVTLAPLPALPPSTVRALEEHRFPVQTSVFWRNADLDMRSLAALAASLGRRPRQGCLQLVEDAEDTRALARLSADPEIAARCRSSANVALLWQVCQIPDYRQLQLDDHFKLLRAVFLQLSGPRARLERDWIARHLEHLSELQGDIDTLLARMAFIRTWTYVTHHTRWLDDAQAFQEQARKLEDDLSDALHERLVRRFVDARSQRSRGRAAARSFFAEQLRHAVGADTDGDGPGLGDLDGWIDGLVEAGGERFGLDDGGRIVADGKVLGRMTRGADRLRPEVQVTLAELGPGARLRLQRRLVAWTRDLAQTLLSALRDPQLGKVGPAARGVLYQLEQGLGTALAGQALAQLRQIEPADRSRLGRAGIKLGRRVLYAAPLLRPEALLVRAALCQAFLGPGLAVPVPGPRTRYFVPSDDVDDDTCLALGYPVLGGVAIRADEAEFLAARIASGMRARPVAERLGCDQAVAEAVVAALAERRRRRVHRGRSV
ncbi:MAG: helicase [Deltaproteobacteria bacterium]|nr:helicase [Deltaproteobacteria bacterium]